MKINNQIWESWTNELLKELYIKDSNMVDVGAHIGTTSLIMSNHISQNCKIYAFEPIYSFITELNIRENNLQDKVKLIPIGLSNKEEQLEGGTIDFSVICNYGFTTLNGLKKSTKESKYIIDIKKLDSLNLQNISFIKIDVEGHEHNVLLGASQTINRCKPTILIELWCTSKNSLKQLKDGTLDYKNPLHCFSILFNWGYICIPISTISDDFLFIHYTNKGLIEKIMKIINK